MVPVMQGAQYTLLDQSRLLNIGYAMCTAIKAGVPGDWLEAGTWMGGGSMTAKAVINALHQEDTRKTWLADSFKSFKREHTQ